MPLATLNEQFIMALAPQLLEILVCPICKGDLKLLQDESGLVCEVDQLKFPVRDGIPIMLVDEAEKLDK